MQKIHYQTNQNSHDFVVYEDKISSTNIDYKFHIVLSIDYPKDQAHNKTIIN